jgi:hypothetical protein
VLVQRMPAEGRNEWTYLHQATYKLIKIQTSVQFGHGASCL